MNATHGRQQIQISERKRIFLAPPWDSGAAGGAGMARPRLQSIVAEEKRLCSHGPSSDRSHDPGCRRRDARRGRRDKFEL